jgi:sugar O-acyltransferase (sialic acid O-acetyltransferase NeuD family)
MSKGIILFPFGGNARESLAAILDINRISMEWDLIGFIDDDPATWSKDCCGVKVLGGREVLEEFPDARILAVPGNPDKYLQRKEVIEGLSLESSRFSRIIHPTVVISTDSKIGYNTILMPNVVISCGVTIGNHCVILPNTVISHDSSVGEFSCVGSNVTISGHVSIGAHCYRGSGTTIRDNIAVGERTMVGIGSTVISDFNAGLVVAGNPARTIRKSV